jgi:histidinol-phosphate aminotransferase
MSYFRPNIDAMEGYKPGYQPKEPGFIKLNTNENPYPPSPRVLEAIRAACGENLRKYPDPAADLLRRQIAQTCGTRPERVLCGNGSDDILNIAVRAFCSEGDRLAFPTPTYGLLSVMARLQNAQAAEVPFPEDYALPAGLGSTGARLTIVANPNSPSGTFVPVADLACLAESLDGVLLIDEAYVEFADGNCLDLVASHDNVIVARTLSKSHSLAGLRIGFAIAQEPLIEGMMKVKDSYNLGALAIAGATAAVADVQWVRANAGKIKATRARFAAELRRIGFQCWPSQSNFVLARVPSGCDAENILERLFERKILVRHFRAPRLKDCLRVSIGTDREMDVVLSALREILAAQGRTQEAMR